MDLDGTLLNNNKQIDDFTLNEIYRLRSEGMHFVVASGRRLSEIVDFTSKLRFDDGDYIITCDGEYLYDYSLQIIWKNQYISSEELMQVVTNGISGKIIVFTDTNDFIIGANFLEIIARKVWYWCKKNKRVMFLHDTRKLTGNIEKVRLDIKNKEKLKGINCRYTFTIHEVFNTYIDITAENVNKMFALAKLLDSLQVCNSEVLYFGDDYNDIECFSNLENTVAVQNAQKEILECSKYTTLTNNERGVGLFLAKIKEGTISDE